MSRSNSRSQRLGLVLTFVSLLTSSFLGLTFPKGSEAAGSKEVSFQFQGLGPNAGGTPVLGGRVRWDALELSVHSFTYEGLAITGAWRSVWRENSVLSPSINASVRRLENDIQFGPGLSLALTLPFFGLGRGGLRLDNDLLYSVQSGSFEPEYLLGFTFVLPGGSR